MSGQKINKDESVTYDRNIIPAETKARMDREGENFKSTGPGQTTDLEGLTNNYAVSPQTSEQEENSWKKKLWQAVAFAAVTWIPISIAIIVSR
ncbi:MAG: hypothetical protein WA902_09230 [Thermosynechococcaceae cyanobacterium]